MNYWLMKTEPETFGVDDLARAPKKTSMWDGVRNYQARNMLRDDFKKGDRAFLYHSSCEIPGIAGVVEVVRTAYPDPTAFEKKHVHFDEGPGRPVEFQHVVRKLIKNQLVAAGVLNHRRRPVHLVGPTRILIGR